MKHREASPDEAIDRVLRGLREVELPGGMQQRVLSAARERADNLHKSPVHLVLANRHSWMVAATVAVIVAAGSWTMARNHRAPQIARHSRQNAPPAVAPVTEAGLSPGRIARPRPVVEPRRTSTDKQATPAEPATDEDLLALSEMNAPSHPAPPMPLTDQEKLLIRILDRGDPIELAMLDPSLRNNQETGDKADFERFFKEPPKVVEIKSPLNNKASTGDEK